MNRTDTIQKMIDTRIQEYNRCHRCTYIMGGLLNFATSITVGLYIGSIYTGTLFNRATLCCITLLTVGCLFALRLYRLSKWYDRIIKDQVHILYNFGATHDLPARGMWLDHFQASARELNRYYKAYETSRAVKLVDNVYGRAAMNWVLRVLRINGTKGKSSCDSPASSRHHGPS